MTSARIGVVLGTRPEAIKLAPVVAALHASANYEPVVISTGQHREILHQMLDLFSIKTDIDLDLMVAGQSLGELTGRVVAQVGVALRELDLDTLIVQGDTTTTMASALAAFYEGIPVAHLEAGLRTGDRYSPFPEEVNRRITTQLASLHLAPTATARDNLLREGVDPATIRVTGNTVIDALFTVAAGEAPFDSDHAQALVDVERSGARVLLVTAHRRESWGSGLTDIARAVAALVAAHPDLVVVFPIHPNPTVRTAMLPVLGGHDRIKVIEPLEYGGFTRLLRRADLVLTDSGGIQEEAVSLGKPTLVTRDTTERAEGIEAGGTLLVGTDPERIRGAVDRLLTDPAAYQAMVCTSLPFGDGHASARVVDALAGLLPTPA